MIPRSLSESVLRLAKQFSVLSVTGPRQSGKTTLIKACFPKHHYVTLENLDSRSFAQSDPKGFLEQYDNGIGIILDEVQNAPDLLSYIQGYVDTSPQAGFYILSGSQNFLVNQAISQSLAGRVAIINLLPLSMIELNDGGRRPATFLEAIFKGGYPKIYASDISPLDWYPNYIRTYLERDVRQIKHITDLVSFQKFIKLCAGRTGQILNMASLALDAGISPNTAKSWLSLLEASYIIHLLQPYYKNYNKRVIKSPKLYFYDTGLVCSLLNIESQEQLITHHMKGELFETFILSEFIKYRSNKARNPQCYYWRDQQGHEIDCLFETADRVIPIEIKSSQTVNLNFFRGLEDWYKISGTDQPNGFIVYGGMEHQRRKEARILPWHDIAKIFES
ncbi:MAG: ATP-binding protein [Gammaproteobacteria bacterium]